MLLLSVFFVESTGLPMDTRICAPPPKRVTPNTGANEKHVLAQPKFGRATHGTPPPPSLAGLYPLDLPKRDKQIGLSLEGKPTQGNTPFDVPPMRTPSSQPIIGTPGVNGLDFEKRIQDILKHPKTTQNPAQNLHDSLLMFQLGFLTCETDPEISCETFEAF